MQDSRIVSAAIAFAVAALGLSLAADAQPLSPKRDAPARGAVGASGGVVQLEESRGGLILYFEESGGMATALTAPVKPKVANAKGTAAGNGAATGNGASNGNGAATAHDTPPKVASVPVARTVAEKR